MEQQIEALRQGMELRQNLISLKQECGRVLSDSGRERLWQERDLFLSLLHEEDSKVRKNTLQILALLKKQDLLPAIFEAYEREQTLFVRPAYLSAMAPLDIGPVVEGLRQRLSYLESVQAPPDEQKHLYEERKKLTTMLRRYDGTEPHGFRGYRLCVDTLLLTNRNHREVTLQAAEAVGARAVLFPAGVQVRPRELRDLFSIRTWSEMLFPVPGCLSVPGTDPKEAADLLAASRMRALLQRMHSGKPPFSFRAECVGKLPREERTSFCKEFCRELCQQCEGDLINDPSGYEFEIRLVAISDGNYRPLLRLRTIPDDRFFYRKNILPTSMSPVNAALCMELAKPYLREKARVLDPFCGTGTMLIERHKLLQADTLYGVDRYRKAIQYARENTEAAGMFAHYVNRDFFDFTHEVPFDEIVTDFPRVEGKQTPELTERLYRDFFEKARELLRRDAILVLYTHNLDWIRRYAKGHYKIEKVWEISAKERTFLAVLRVR